MFCKGYAFTAQCKLASWKWNDDGVATAAACLFHIAADEVAQTIVYCCIKPYDDDLQDVFLQPRLVCGIINYLCFPAGGGVDLGWTPQASVP